ncbi:hypothetical protein M408DRAFT_29365 [Serendipita vermifera MAFF 305830]|uniref:Uncharacterized protein n=1 Tax=Serendipita vermifera MAFF 305830 TaxID=933852 RepID=A0A0C3AQY6_SERVB|nr:hypothetical protein M408DRAFT_29365 [Serendipita vermifera MAFF 305830]
MNVVDLQDIGHYSSILGQLEHLSLRADKRDYLEYPPTYVNHITTPNLPLLTTLHYHARFQPALGQLLISTWSTLQCLDIQIGILDVIDVTHTLRAATSLRCFTLTLLLLDYDLDANGERRQYQYYPRNITYTVSQIQSPSWNLANVETFKCAVRHFEGKEIPGSLDVDNLWRIFHAIFPKLRALVWNLPIRSRELLASLGKQEQLTHFESTAILSPSYTQGKGVISLNLQSLSVNNPRVFHGMLMSNLTHLSATWNDKIEIPPGMSLERLESLTLIIGSNVKQHVELNPRDFPFLKSLSITFNGSGSSFKLPNLLTLIEVRIATQPPALIEAMQLCGSLVCEPEICPKLEKIHLDSFIQWEILFVLLKRRNFGLHPAISKIKELGLPRIAPRFRPVLTSLLNGQEVPPDLLFYCVMEWLSIRQVQLRLLDAHINGCAYCVYTGISDCREQVQRRQEYGADIGELPELFPSLQWEKPRDESTLLTDHDQVWMKKYSEDILLWKHMAREWSKLHHRKLICHTRPCFAKVILSDRDTSRRDLFGEMDLER